jgi:hypothetical protein
MPVELIVQGDDFGMCHAVNDGVVRAICDGIVTQASVMAACPWVDEAAGLPVPVGLHQTLTCEWDFLRWGPLTPAPSLRAGDGTFHRTVRDAQEQIDTEEATTELLAQAARVTGLGLELSYTDVHMGMVAPAAYQMVAMSLGLPFLYPGLEASVEFTSIAMLSAHAATRKKGWFLDHLAGLAPGLHLVVTHPGVAGAELRAMTAPTSGPWPWAEEFRASDLEVLTDPEIRACIDDLGIVLTSLRDALLATPREPSGADPSARST